MRKITTFIILLWTFFANSQTTDLAISVEARNTNNTQVSQLHIFEEFYYLITITNSGNAVSNAIFSQTLNTNIQVLDYNGLNALGGATLPTDLTMVGNQLTGTLPNMPASSSLQIKVSAYAPLNPGGISTSTSVLPPDGTTDINESSNQSIISTNIYEVALDFSITQIQTNPPAGSGISNWGNTVTYQFTLTNNSSIDFPIENFIASLYLNTSTANGTATAQLMSVSCIGASGMNCISLSDFSSTVANIDAASANVAEDMFEQETTTIFPAGASITIQLIYKFNEGNCALNVPEPIEINSIMNAYTLNNTYSSFTSNIVTTPLLEATYCPCTDVGIETEVINGLVNGAVLNWEDEITFETVITNYGPIDTSTYAMLQNILGNYIPWEIISVTCTETVGNVDCSTITYNYTSTSQQWTSSYFDLAVGESVTFETVVKFFEPDCATSTVLNSNVKTTKVQTDPDCETNNNYDNEIFELPSSDLCENTDISVTKTQIAPQLPLGSSASTPTSWEPITYEIVVSNNSNTDTYFELKEYYNFVSPANTPQYTGTLISVNCTETTGTANCQDIPNAYIGVENDSTGDFFFEITPEENWLLPQNSSITFEMVIEWNPNCGSEPVPVATKTLIDTIDPILDANSSNNAATVITYFTPCVDLIVQTYPSSPTVSVDSNFNWIIDISNSSNSSTATNATFSTTLNSAFIINGNPTCSVTQGNASCISGFSVSGNSISGIIPTIDPGASMQVIVPTMSPTFGGSFNNIAEVNPDILSNGEVDPETNISISSIQVLAPQLDKYFEPNAIQTGQISTLVFTITNITGNPEQYDVSFLDQLPAGISLVDSPQWENQNGTTATFVGAYGDDFVGVQGLYFPEGVANCSFSVNVTASDAGDFINENANFSDRFNIETTNTYATLTVTENPTPELDLSITKTVDNETPQLGDVVTFEIVLTNNSNVFASEIEITEILPEGYQFISATMSTGNYDETYWTIPILNANESATLTIIASVTHIEEYINTATITYLQQIDRDSSNNSDSALVTPQCFDIYNGVSPNGDAFNEYFVIDCIDYFEQNNVKIFNRHGVLVFEQDNYSNTWNGRANKGALKNANQLLPVGTYYYLISIPGMDPRTGWLYLNY
ncbi:conserved repeat domain-containing protein/gliding motility-associated C-terminal domain-containing protein [Pustulibacterium marinum]|uniref:Conserved repeat domain-containing protein/gliding motility-associated C-terminal domain-containing protein n=1 Tax=Pustulibacterium marinum TaxID=1224947 RepID=A0A1I7EUN9_9FLAO|nr:gliding motility-associated C-terminal domain-containing protein [Pustulibacterium marinum]SFU27644.1 conserved repeat domain-containing protein/gliding motility-associated C-terminal domain-containing protein [Pustulibacterium marinum]